MIVCIDSQHGLSDDTQSNTSSKRKVFFESFKKHILCFKKLTYFLLPTILINSILFSTNIIAKPLLTSLKEIKTNADSVTSSDSRINNLQNDLDFLTTTCKTFNEVVLQIPGTHPFLNPPCASILDEKSAADLTADERQQTQEQAPDVLANESQPSEPTVESLTQTELSNLKKQLADTLHSTNQAITRFYNAHSAALVKNAKTENPTTIKSLNTAVLYHTITEPCVKKLLWEINQQCPESTTSISSNVPASLSQKKSTINQRSYSILMHSVSVISLMMQPINNPMNKENFKTFQTTCKNNVEHLLHDTFSQYEKIASHPDTHQLAKNVFELNPDHSYLIYHAMQHFIAAIDLYPNKKTNDKYIKTINKNLLNTYSAIKAQIPSRSVFNEKLSDAVRTWENKLSKLNFQLNKKKLTITNS